MALTVTLCGFLVHTRGCFFAMVTKKQKIFRQTKGKKIVTGPPIEIESEGIVWLAELALGLPEIGDPQVTEFRKKLQPYTSVTIGKQTYQMFLTTAGRPWVVNKNYRLYVCSLPNGRFGIAKVSAKNQPDDDTKSLPIEQIVANAAALRHESSLMQGLRQASLDLDDSLPEEERYYHHSFFPEVVATQHMPDGRFMFIMAYPRFIKTLAQIDPISRLLTQKQRGDLGGAWLDGKLLKILAWIHSKDITNGFIAPANILIAGKQHLPIIFDWRYAKQHDYLTLEQQKREVQQAAMIYVQFAGGMWSDGKLTLPYDSHIMTEAQYEIFTRHFTHILSGNCGTALQEHKRLYELCDATWPKFINNEGNWQRPFHEFQLYPI